MQKKTPNYESGYSNWLNLYSNLSANFYEIAIVGENAKAKITEINKYYIPNKLIEGSTKESDTPLLRNRFVKNKTLIYVCKEGTCKLPTDNVNVAITSIRINRILTE